MSGRSSHTLIVFSDDWGRHPSSCQHLVHHLADRDTIKWINTVGMRSPKIDFYTIKRAIEKLRLKEKVDTAKSDSPLTVSGPIMWPWFALITA